MPRQKTGAAIIKWREKNGKKIKEWHACITIWKDGKRIQRLQKPKDNTKTAAKLLAKKMLDDLDEHGEKSIEAMNMTFAQLADFYQKNYLVEAEYVNDRKVAGYRSKYEIGLRLEILRKYFRNRKVQSITHGDIKRFKIDRLKTPVIAGKNTRGTEKEGKPVERQRSIATVHKELGLLRRVLNVAFSNGWINRNPFSMGDALISPGDERQRERILTRDEEEKLLLACTGYWAHLKSIIICAIDTGMRRGEIFKLRWSDIDFENGIINIRAFNTKTLRQRHAAITARLFQELMRVWENSTQNPDELVFGVATSTKKAFATLRTKVGLPDLRFHDLRHTNATRLVSQHLPLSEVGRMLGHTQANTTYRYVNANVETAKRAAAMLDDFNNPVDEGESPIIN
jgi:integrase